LRLGASTEKYIAFYMVSVLCDADQISADLSILAHVLDQMWTDRIIARLQAVSAINHENVGTLFR